MTPSEKFVLAFLRSAEVGELMRDHGQLWIEVPRELLLRARRLAQGIEARREARRP